MSVSVGKGATMVATPILTDINQNKPWTYGTRLKRSKLQSTLSKYLSILIGSAMTLAVTEDGQQCKS